MKCPTCKHAKLVEFRELDTVNVGEVSFCAEVAARRCVACGEVLTNAADLAQVELAAAVWLAKYAPESAVSFRFMRTTLELTGQELARLLKTTPETVSRWENGARSVDSRAFALLAALVIDASEGRTVLRNTLEGMRTALEPVSVVRLQVA